LKDPLVEQTNPGLEAGSACTVRGRSYLLG